MAEPGAYDPVQFAARRNQARRDTETLTRACLQWGRLEEPIVAFNWERVRWAMYRLHGVR